MTEPTKVRLRLVANLERELTAALRGTPWRVQPTEPPSDGSAARPAALLVDDGHEPSRPVLAVEIVPGSDEARNPPDLVRNFPSLREVLVVSAATAEATQHTRDEHGGWEQHTKRDSDDELTLPSVDARVAMAAIYAGTGLADPKSDRAPVSSVRPMAQRAPEPADALTRREEWFKKRSGG